MSDVILFDAHIVPNLAREFSNKAFQVLAFGMSLSHLATPWLSDKAEAALCAGYLIPFSGQ